MSNVELVIKLPEEVKNRLCFGVTYPKDIQVICEALNNGIQLLEGHGDIVDIETLIDMFWDGDSMEITKYDLSVIEPIIKADKAEGSGEE